MSPKAAVPTPPSPRSRPRLRSLNASACAASARTRTTPNMSTSIRSSRGSIWRHARSWTYRNAASSRTRSPSESRAMSLTVRRVDTGHDHNGCAKILIDDVATNVFQGRPGAYAANIWIADGFPVDNDGSTDTSGRKVGTTLANGIVFRVVSFGPGVTPRNHRTD